MGIGLFGGTFDPVHMGHLRLAEEVRETFSLDKVYFVPAGIQPLKGAAGGAGAEDRVRMLKAALRGNAFFRTSTVEIERGGISYSIDTVRQFCRRFDEVYFLVGADAFCDIGLWKDFEELLSSTNFIVTVRPGRSFEGPPEALKRQVGRVGDSTWEHASGRKIHFFRMTQLDISSTRIRDLSRKGRSVKYLVPSSVERYIMARGLYRN